MTRASITIRTKKGISYDAAMVMPVFEDHTMRPLIAFVCSGRMHTVPADEVESLAFYPTGTTFCGMCDEPLNQRIVQSQ